MVVNIVYQPDWTSSFEWTIYVGFVICFFLSFGMGANDCANSYSAVIGSGVLKIWQAYILATIFETLGAGLLGYEVTDTIRQGIVDPSIYSVFVQQNENNQWIEVDSCSINSSTAGLSNCTELTRAEYLMGEIGALTGTAFWLIFAGIFSLPVSATQSVVGATVGFTLVFHGTEGIKLSKIIQIIVSWVASPVLAGSFSVIIFLTIKFSTFKRENPFEASLNTSPFWLWFTLAVNLFSVFYDGSKYLGFDKITWWQSLLISNGIGFIFGLFMWLFGRNWMRRAVLRIVEANNQKKATGKDLKDTIRKISSKKYILEINQEFHSQYPEPVIFTSSSHGSCVHIVASDLTENRSKGVGFYIKSLTAPFKEEPQAIKVFSYLQILSSCFLAFSHGSNSANSVGPLVGLFVTYQSGLATVKISNNGTTECIILFGAASMLIGLWVLGHRVIRTMGKNLSEITAPSGFAISLGTAFTVLFASKIGIPVSTTHSMVGAVLCVGIARSNMKNVSWKTFRNIVFAWLVTTPVAGLVSAGVAWLLVHFILGTY